MIYLDDAKQAILDLPNAYNGFSDSYDKSCIIDVLESLPSAQPEPCEDTVSRQRLLSDLKELVAAVCKIIEFMELWRKQNQPLFERNLEETDVQ